MLRFISSIAGHISYFRLRLPNRDWLTGLKSNRSFRRDLNRATRNPDQQLSLLFVDLDKLKELNDRLGYMAGDNALRVVAKALSKRASCYRFGGDEFAVLAPVAKSDALLLAESMRANIANLTVKEHPDLTLSISIGMATFPEEVQTVDELWGRAWAAMHRAKADGRNCVRASESLS